MAQSCFGCSQSGKAWYLGTTLNEVREWIMWVLENIILDRENTKYKGPEAAAQLCSRNNIEANLAGVNNEKNDGHWGWRSQASALFLGREDQYTNEIPKEGWPWGRQGFGDSMRWGTYLPMSGSIVYNDSGQRRRRTKSSIVCKCPKDAWWHRKGSFSPWLRSPGLSTGHQGECGRSSPKKYSAIT